MDVDLYDSLQGQTALVTGATRGIGAAIATALVDTGATVYAGARDPADVPDDDRRPVRLDVTEDDEVAAAIDRIADETGRLDVLVNNAGRAPPPLPLHEADLPEIEATLETNLRGPIRHPRGAPAAARPSGRPGGERLER